MVYGYMIVVFFNIDSYVDYCFLKYSAFNYEGVMTLCQSDYCEVIPLYQMSLEIIQTVILEQIISLLGI
jgi:hypothetical protein